MDEYVERMQSNRSLSNWCPATAVENRPSTRVHGARRSNSRRVMRETQGAVTNNRKWMRRLNVNDGAAQRVEEGRRVAAGAPPGPQQRGHAPSQRAPTQVAIHRRANWLTQTICMPLHVRCCSPVRMLIDVLNNFCGAA